MINLLSFLPSFLPFYPRVTVQCDTVLSYLEVASLLENKHSLRNLHVDDSFFFVAIVLL